MIALAMVNSDLDIWQVQMIKYHLKSLKMEQRFTATRRGHKSKNSSDGSESGIELTQDESFRYVKLTSDDGDISHTEFKQQSPEIGDRSECQP